MFVYIGYMPIIMYKSFHNSPGHALLNTVPNCDLTRLEIFRLYLNYKLLVLIDLLWFIDDDVPNMLDNLDKCDEHPCIHRCNME